LALPNRWPLLDFIPIAAGSYLYKLFIAIAITPLIYLAHGLIDRFLGREET
jgi:hypothetical protein